MENGIWLQSKSCSVTVALKSAGRLETKPSPGEDFLDVENSTSAWSPAAEYAR